MPAVRGKDFKFYRNTDNPYDNSPTWSLVPNLKDVTSNVEADLADASIRGSEFHLQVTTLKTLSIDSQMVYDNTDTDVIAFETAFYGTTPDTRNVEILILDGLISVVGSRGIRFMAQLSKFTVNQALGDVGLVDITFVPGYAPLDAPRRVSVASPGSVTDT